MFSIQQIANVWVQFLMNLFKISGSVKVLSQIHFIRQ